MKPNTLSMLAVALSTAFLVAACDRDREPEPAPSADTTMPAEPAPAPEPVPAPEPATMPAPAPVDSGLAFADMDKNKDGGITHDELADSEMLHQHFSQADTDADGKLSPAEVDKHRADMAAAPAG